MRFGVGASLALVGLWLAGHCLALAPSLEQRLEQASSPQQLMALTDELTSELAAGRLTPEGASRALAHLSSHPSQDQTSLRYLNDRIAESDQALSLNLWRLSEQALMQEATATHAGLSLGSMPERKLARGRGAMVATGCPSATQAAAGVLRAGGSAPDAAAAALAALCVADPDNTALGGRCQSLWWNGEHLLTLDGATQQPAGVPPRRQGVTREGWQIAPIPGNPAMLGALAERGRLGLDRDLAEPVALARKGFRIPPHLGLIWAGQAAHLSRDPGTRSLFLSDRGYPPQVGQTFRQEQLGDTLAKLAAQGPSTLYRGPLGRCLVEDSQRGGGFLSLEDLAQYRVLSVPPLHFRYRDVEVVTGGGSSSWGPALLEMLGILAHFDIREDSVDSQARVALALLCALVDQRAELEPSLRISGGFTARRARELDQALAGGPQALKGFINAQLDEGRIRRPSPDGDTSHLCILDGQGQAVSLTTSVGRRFGARAASPQLGMLMAQSYKMDSGPQPLARDITAQTPTMLFREGHLIAVLGAAGSRRIPQAVAQTIVQLVDRGADAESAILAPRLGWPGNRLQLHVGMAPSTVAGLEKLGFEPQLSGRGHEGHLGVVQLITIDPRTGQRTAVADPSYDGTAQAVATY